MTDIEYDRSGNSNLSFRIREDIISLFICDFLFFQVQ